MLLRGQIVRKSNLIPNTERTPEELREMGRKGGIASGRARRRKAKLQKEAKLWLQVFDEMEKKDPEGFKRLCDDIKKRLR